MRPLTLLELDRLFSNIDTSGGLDACWPWTASLKKESGYGQIMIWGSMQLAHRVVCYLMHGDYGNLNALHHCDNRPCCNPFHLYPGTQKRNVQDAVERGRYRCGGEGKFGSSNSNSHYSDEQIARIHELLKTSMSQRAIAAEVGCTQRLVSQIYRGVAHANLERVPERRSKFAGPDETKQQEIRKLVSEGLGPYQIAQRVGCTPRAINRLIRQEKQEPAF